MNYTKEDYKMFFKLINKLVSEHKDFFERNMKSDIHRKIIILETEIKYRIINSKQELTENITNEINKKIESIQPIINSYMDYLEGHIEFDKIENVFSELNIKNSDAISSKEININFDKTFEYGLTYRPPSIGSVPSGYIINEKSDSNFRYGTISYSKKLTENELDIYELIDLSDEHFSKMLEKVITDMGKYAKKYIEYGDNVLLNKINTSLNQRFSTKIDFTRMDEFKEHLINKIKDLTLPELNTFETTEFDSLNKDLEKMYEIAYNNAETIFEINQNKEANMIYLKYKGTSNSKQIVESFYKGLDTAKKEWELNDAKEIVSEEIKKLNIQEGKSLIKPP